MQPYDDDEFWPKSIIPTQDSPPVFDEPTVSTDRYVCISDTHGQHADITLPPGDILIHAGDATRSGSYDECILFLEWLTRQRHFQHIILVPGNHDIHMQEAIDHLHIPPMKLCYLPCGKCPHTGVVGIALTQRIGHADGWAYGVSNDLEFQDQIETLLSDDSDVDILVTHAPPIGIGDMNRHGVSCGSRPIRQLLQRCTPRVHIFGHIHEGHGIYCGRHMIQPSDHESSPIRLSTWCINASICDRLLHPVNLPIIIDIPFQKQHVATIPYNEQRRIQTVFL